MSDESSPIDELPAAEDGPSAIPSTAVAPEVSRRVSSILDAVEQEAARLREDARDEARRYLNHSRERADALVSERQRRIAELSDEIMAKAQAIIGRLDDAVPVRDGFESLVSALGDAAERLSQEADRTADDYQPPPFHETQREPAPEPAPPPLPPAPVEPGGYADPQPYETWRPPTAGAAAGGYVPAASEPPPAPRAPAFPTEPPAMRQTGGTSPDGLDDAKLVAIQMAAGGRTRDQVREHLQGTMGVADARPLLDEIFGVGSAEDSRVPWTAFPR